MNRKAFCSRRTGKDLAVVIGSFLMAGACIGVLVLLVVSVVGIWPAEQVGLITAAVILFSLAFSLLVALVMLTGAAFFGGFGIWGIGKWFRPDVVLQVLPEGIWGSTNVPEVNLIPWECIASVRLKNWEERTVIGIQTANWPPVPVWKKCSGATRRMLWKRYNRRQAPLILYIHDADAPPEIILHTIEEELNRVREREIAPHPPKEGGTPLC